MNADEIAYSKIVTKLADSGSPELISNGDESHARILIHQLLIRGTERITIFSSCLKPAIYNNERVIFALKEFLNRQGVKLEILLQSPDKEVENREFFKLCNSFPGKCEIKHVVNKEHKELKAHFVTMDNKAYRFCADSTKPKTEAVASFNRPKTAINLLEQFKYLFAAGEPYPNRE